MLLYVAYEQHLTILVIFLILNQLQNLRDVGLELLACFKFEVAWEKLIDLKVYIEVYNEGKEW